jgi:hypothetical protein
LRLAILLAGVAILLLILWPKPDAFRARYDRLQLGMTVPEVEAILGPGEEVPEDRMPGVPPHVRPMRDGRFAPLVEGERFFRWQEQHEGFPPRTIWVGVRGGKVCDKMFHQFSL